MYLQSKSPSANLECVRTEDSAAPSIVLMSFVTQFRAEDPRVFMWRLVLVGNFFLDWVFLLSCGILHTYLINVSAAPSSKDYRGGGKHSDNNFCIQDGGDHTTLSTVAFALHVIVYTE